MNDTDTSIHLAIVALTEAMEFLENGTPIHPGSELEHDLRNALDSLKAVSGEPAASPNTIVLDLAGWCDGKVDMEYSGRGMYGSTCIGIVCADPHELIAEAGRRGLRGAKTDNMGLEYIVYWPAIGNRANTRN